MGPLCWCVSQVKAFLKFQLVVYPSWSRGLELLKRASIQGERTEPPAHAALIPANTPVCICLRALCRGTGISPWAFKSDPHDSLRDSGLEANGVEERALDKEWGTVGSNRSSIPKQLCVTLCRHLSLSLSPLSCQIQMRPPFSGRGVAVQVKEKRQVWCPARSGPQQRRVLSMLSLPPFPALPASWWARAI